MTPISKLADLLAIDELAPFRDRPSTWFTARDEIKGDPGADARAGNDRPLAGDPGAGGCVVRARVLDWQEVLDSEAFGTLDMLQTVTREDGVSILTTRSPVRIDGQRNRVARAAPRIGEHSASIRAEFGLEPKR